MKKIQKFVYSFIPKFVPASILLFFMDLLTVAGGLKKREIEENYKKNKKEWTKYSDKKKFITNQGELSAFALGKNNERLSRKYLDGSALSASANACEVIAVYNAMLELGRGVSFPKLISVFEGKGIMRKGYFGTAPNSLKKYFKNNNVKVEKIAGRKISKESLGKLEQNFAAYIFTSFNDKENIGAMIHTMCVVREKGGFRRLNDSGERSIYKTLYEAVYGYREGQGKPIVVMGVGDSNEK